MVPTAYIPVVNQKVFKQMPFDWEWGLIFAEFVIFVIVAEVYKMLKRRYFARKGYLPSGVAQMEEVRVGTDGGLVHRGLGV